MTKIISTIITTIIYKINSIIITTIIKTIIAIINRVTFRWRIQRKWSFGDHAMIIVIIVLYCILVMSEGRLWIIYKAIRLDRRNPRALPKELQQKCNNPLINYIRQFLNMFLDGRSDRIQTPERSEYIFSNLYYILKIHKKSKFHFRYLMMYNKHKICA